jgi:hypothetical protein
MGTPRVLDFDFDFEQACRGNPERLGQAVDHREGGISFSTLDPADISTVDARPSRQILLGESERGPDPPDQATELQT